MPVFPADFAKFVDQMMRRYPLFRVAHKKPCRECPFRYAHPAGWLGPDPVEAYLVSIQNDFPISCHLTRSKKKEPAQCAGSAIHYVNQCKEPRREDFRKVIAQFEKTKQSLNSPTSSKSTTKQSGRLGGKECLTFNEEMDRLNKKMRLPFADALGDLLAEYCDLPQSDILGELEIQVMAMRETMED